ncbi:MAG: acyl--CoA ligase [Gammaproteobacteria bacterium]|nr:acyl--CoA ligase [Gammaproteobacteria bacterium]
MEEKDKRIEKIFAEAAYDSPDVTHLLLAGQGTRVSYAETYYRARCLAGALQKRGVGFGDRVASFLYNTREAYELYIACGLLGAITVAVNTQSKPRELKKLFADCEPKALICSNFYLERMIGHVLPASVEVRVVTHLSENTGVAGWLNYDLLMQSAPCVHPVNQGGPKDPAVMIYSSGTTGEPKGILLSHQALIDNALLASRVLGLNCTDRSLTLLPIFSSFGFAFDFLQMGLLRASVVILPAFSETEALDAIERYRVTFLAGVPVMFSRLFTPSLIEARQLDSLRLMDVGGGPVSPRLKSDLKKTLGVTVCESYGMTEISPVASVQSLNDDPESSSCGLPLPGFEVKVVDSGGEPVPRGKPGELLFQSPTFMLSYWNKPEQTAKTLAGGWLHSGDYGYRDEKGNIHILDRTKDMIVTNGFNVYPKEVENIIMELASVQSVAVVGIKDDVRGEQVFAFVELHPGGHLDPSDVINYCDQHLARFKVPREVIMIPEIPLTASGKIQRFKLRELATQQQKEPGQKHTESVGA